MSSRKHDSRKVNPKSRRQGLCYWLEAQINSGKIPGLQWLNYEQRVFRIPWKHASKPDWKGERDAAIFKAWAEHTGKYREGIDNLDWSTWKTQFRCALNKSPNVQSIKELSNEESLDDPIKVYQFIGNSESMDFNTESSSSSPMQIIPDENKPLPDFLTIGVSESESLPSDLKQINSDQLLIETSANTLNTSQAGTAATMEIQENVFQECQNSNMQKNDKCHETTNSTNFFTAGIDVFPNMPNNFLSCTVRFITMEYDKKEKINGGFSIHSPEMEFTPQGLVWRPQLLHIPIVLNMNNQHLQMTNQQRETIVNLLRDLTRGIIFECEDGDIYATRHCRLSVFVLSPSLNQGSEPFRVPRHTRIKVFSYKDYFEPVLAQYHSSKGQSPKPVPEILVGFGQTWKASLFNPYRTLLISATIVSLKAEESLRWVSVTNPFSNPVFKSEADQVDQVIETFENVHINNGEIPFGSYADMNQISQETWCQEA